MKTKEFIARVELSGELIEVRVDADTIQAAVERCWELYGMSSYIESIRELEETHDED
jgi:hypothetical protein